MIPVPRLLRAPLRRGVQRLRELRRYVRQFGLTRGAIVRYKLWRVKKGIIRVSIPQSRTPIALRAGTSDLPTFADIFLDDCYAIPVETHPHLIIDGGANVGYASLYYANRYPEARIIAVEPEASNHELLRVNTSGYANISVLRAGLWHRRTRLTIKNPTAAKWGFQVQESALEEGSIDAVTIDEIVENAGAQSIDILKLDIEGAEKELFSAADTWLGKVQILIVELHDRFRPGCSESFHSAVAKQDFASQRRGEHVILLRNRPLESRACA